LPGSTAESTDRIAAANSAIDFDQRGVCVFDLRVGGEDSPAVFGGRHCVTAGGNPCETTLAEQFGVGEVETNDDSSSGAVECPERSFFRMAVLLETRMSPAATVKNERHARQRTNAK
jgi:hypothetical protein